MTATTQPALGDIITFTDLGRGASVTIRFDGTGTTYAPGAAPIHSISGVEVGGGGRYATWRVDDIAGLTVVETAAQYADRWRTEITEGERRAAEATGARPSRGAERRGDVRELMHQGKRRLPIYLTRSISSWGGRSLRVVVADTLVSQSTQLTYVMSTYFDVSSVLIVEGCAQVMVLS